MPAAPNEVFSTLLLIRHDGDLQRRLLRELTVHALTDRAGVSQPAVSKHLRVLKLARLCATGAMAARPITAPVRRVLRL